METIHCQQCGAANSGRSGQCWLCHHPLAAEPSQTRGLSPTTAVATASTANTFTLSSLMLIVALIAVCLGVMREVPGLGIALAVVSTPALVRTVFAARRRERTGRPMSTGEKVVTFLGSVGVVATVCVASGVAFVTICFPVGLASFNISSGDGGGIVLAFGLGILAALVVAALLFRRLWPRKE